MPNPYNLSDSEIKQIDALAAAANKPNINLMAGMMAGDAPVANMASQINAQQVRGRQQRVGRLESALAAKAGRAEQAGYADARTTRALGAASSAAALKREQDLEDAKRERAQKVQDRDLLAAHKVELQKLKNAGKASAAKKEANRIAGMEARARVQHAGRQKPTALATKETEKLVEMRTNMTSLNRALETIEPEFFDTVTAIGGAQNYLANNFGNLIPDEWGWHDRANWHKDYKKHLVLKERNDFFGAALTETEQREWKLADISEGMPFAQVQANLTKRVGILQDVMTRHAETVSQSRRNPEAVSYATGIPAKDLPTGRQPFPEELDLMFQQMRADALGENEAANIQDMEAEELAAEIARLKAEEGAN